MNTPLVRSLSSLVVLIPTLAAPGFAQDATELPALPAAASGVIELPLVAEGALRWRSVGADTTLTTGERGLAVTYHRAARTACGAALAFRSGSLAGLGALELRLGNGGRGAALLVSLRNAAGSVHSFAPIRLDGEPSALRLDVADIAPDVFQGRRTDAGPFDPAQVTILSIVDIAGFLGGAQEDVAWTLSGVRAVMDDAAEAGSRPRAAESPSPGKQRFLDALVHGEGAADAALPALLVEAMQRSGAPDSFLWLALNQLWLAAEGDHGDPRTLEHAVLANVWFERFRAAGGVDDRLPSWTVPLALSLDRAFDFAPADADLVAPLREAFGRDPGFHGFALGLIGLGAPVDSAVFQNGLAAVRAALAADGGDPSVQNRPHWPHNREGFLLLAADYEHRAGNTAKARRLLDTIERVEDFPRWPFRDEVSRRRALWDRGGSVDHTNGWMQSRSCVICHRDS